MQFCIQTLTVVSFLSLHYPIDKETMRQISEAYADDAQKKAIKGYRAGRGPGEDTSDGTVQVSAVYNFICSRVKDVTYRLCVCAWERIGEIHLKQNSPGHCIACF